MRGDSIFAQTSQWLVYARDARASRRRRALYTHIARLGWLTKRTFVFVYVLSLSLSLFFYLVSDMYTTCIKLYDTGIKLEAILTYLEAISNHLEAILKAS